MEKNKTNEAQILFPYMVSIYSSHRSNVNRGTDDKAAAERAREWFGGTKFGSYNGLNGTTLQSPVVLKVAGESFTLYRIGRDLTVLATGRVKPGNTKFGTFYGYSADGWEYSFHCFSCESTGLILEIREGAQEEAPGADTQ